MMSNIIIHKSQKEIVFEYLFRLFAERGTEHFETKTIDIDVIIEEMKKHNGKQITKTPKGTVSNLIGCLHDMGIVERVFRTTKQRSDKGKHRIKIHNVHEAIAKYKEFGKKKKFQGELACAKVFAKWGYDYVEQFVDPRIKYKRSFRFDGFIPPEYFVDLSQQYLKKHNRELTGVLVEYDGADHNQVVRRSRSLVKDTIRYFTRQHYDRLKDKLSKEHDYMLIRVNCRDVLVNNKVNSHLLEKNISEQIAKLSMEL